LYSVRCMPGRVVIIIHQRPLRHDALRRSRARRLGALRWCRRARRAAGHRCRGDGLCRSRKRGAAVHVEHTRRGLRSHLRAGPRCVCRRSARTRLPPRLSALLHHAGAAWRGLRGLLPAGPHITSPVLQGADPGAPSYIRPRASQTHEQSAGAAPGRTPQVRPPVQEALARSAAPAPWCGNQICPVAPGRPPTLTRVPTRGAPGRPGPHRRRTPAAAAARPCRRTGTPAAPAAAPPARAARLLGPLARVRL